MNRYKIAIELLKVEKFLYICKAHKIHIVSASCNNGMFYILYEHDHEILPQNVHKMYLDCFKKG